VPFSRLPIRVEDLVREPVWELAQHTAGISVRFVTDSPRVAVRWPLLSESLAMDHMPATGVSGLDLYLRDGERWRWAAVGRARKAPTNESDLISEAPPETREYLLYLPLYNGLESLEIGVTPGSEIAAAAPWPEERRRPLCFYGTSITQGGCASRPGMAYPAILGRRLARPTVNLGFSGNGRMDPELADLLGEIDAEVYVLDCGGNMTTEWITERTVPFIRALREARPDTPIVLIETVEYQDAWHLTSRRESIDASNSATRAAHAELVAEGVTGIHLVACADFLGDDSEATVDGVHFTDLGFQRMSDALEPLLRTLID
jgi:lysophospholipase L1-like esterase